MTHQRNHAGGGGCYSGGRARDVTKATVGGADGFEGGEEAVGFWDGLVEVLECADGEERGISCAVCCAGCLIAPMSRIGRSAQRRAVPRRDVAPAARARMFRETSMMSDTTATAVGIIPAPRP